MPLKSWYQRLLLAWAILVIPGFILGWAYAGRAPESLVGILRLCVLGCLLSPVLLAPFGITRRAVLLKLAVVGSVAVCAWVVAREFHAAPAHLAGICTLALCLAIAVITREVEKASPNELG